MGVKSTVRLTRADAVRRAADLHQKRERRAVEALYYGMGDEELENELERLNDAAKGGEGFENYLITDESN